MLCKFLKLDFIFLQFVFAICQRIFDGLFWIAGGFEVEATQRTGGEKSEELPQESLAATRKSGGESERTACLGIRKEKKRFTFLCCRVLLINLNPRLEPPDQGFSWEPGFPGWPIKNKIRFPRWSLKKKISQVQARTSPLFRGLPPPVNPFHLLYLISQRESQPTQVEGQIRDISREN